MVFYVQAEWCSMCKRTGKVQTTICCADGNASAEESINVDWDTEDELEIQNFPLSSNSSLTLTNPGGGAVMGAGEASSSAGSSAGSSHSKLINHFVGMGFPENMVAKAIQENGNCTVTTLRDIQLKRNALENSPEQQLPLNSDNFSSEYEENVLSHSDNWSEDEEITDSLSDTEKTLLSLANMGYTVEDASLAMNKCGEYTIMC
ncbi:hypothetical protein U1Q18_012461 [Sarracenia purpurea var. burkii]